MGNINIQYELLIRAAHQTGANQIEYGDQSTFDRLLMIEAQIKDQPDNDDLLAEHQEQFKNIKATLETALDLLIDRITDSTLSNELVNQKIDVNRAQNADELAAVIPIAKNIADSLD